VVAGLLIAYYRILVLELRWIERFVGCDPKVAEEAFVEISKHVEAFLWGYLASRLPNEEDRKDAMRIVLERLWTNRTKIEVRTLSSWWSFVAKSAKWCVYDQIGKPIEQGLSEDIQADDLAFIEVVASMDGKRSKIYRAADELWLGVEPDVNPMERKQRLLAAQLHYLHGRSWDEISEIVAIHEPITRDRFDAWLVNPAVLLELCYTSLHMQGDQVVGYLLRPSKPLKPKEVQEWFEAANSENPTAPDEWTWDEVKVAILKYRNGLPDFKISQMTGISPGSLNEVVAKCRSRLPFVVVAKLLVRRFKLGRLPIDPFSFGGLWKRLVFQYTYCGEHAPPQKQIMDFAGSAAEASGYKLTSGMLNVWISNQRLLNQLRGYLGDEEGDFE
jgi:DNA-directed RNA polymerase specialized sigma24 family protein